MCADRERGKEKETTDLELAGEESRVLVGTSSLDEGRWHGQTLGDCTIDGPSCRVRLPRDLGCRCRLSRSARHRSPDAHFLLSYTMGIHDFTRPSRGFLQRPDDQARQRDAAHRPAANNQSNVEPSPDPVRRHRRKEGAVSFLGSC